MTTNEEPFEITCDDVSERLLCGEKATTLIVMEGEPEDTSAWFTIAYCDEHVEMAAEEAEDCLPGEYVIITLTQEKEKES